MVMAVYWFCFKPRQQLQGSNEEKQNKFKKKNQANEQQQAEKKTNYTNA